MTAQRKADARARRSRKPLRMAYDPLLSWVMDALRKGWTPERIEGRLKVQFPDDPRMRVSHECLYQWIYAKPQKTLDLRQYLPRGKRHRTRAKGRRSKGPRIPMRVPIAQRPKRVDSRLEFGHFESDTVIGTAPSKRCIVTQVERKSRRLFARFIPTRARWRPRAPNTTSTVASPRPRASTAPGTTARATLCCLTSSCLRPNPEPTLCM